MQSATTCWDTITRVSSPRQGALEKAIDVLSTLIACLPMVQPSSSGEEAIAKNHPHRRSNRCRAYKYPSLLPEPRRSTAALGAQPLYAPAVVDSWRRAAPRGCHQSSCMAMHGVIRRPVLASTIAIASKFSCALPFES